MLPHDNEELRILKIVLLILILYIRQQGNNSQNQYIMQSNTN